MQLPFEVLTIVFSHLPPKDLDNVKLVCRDWRDVASDRVWKQRFENNYGTTHITRVATASTQWRRELLMRQAVLAKWRRCVKEHDVTSNSTLINISHLFPNFASDSARAICFNTHTGSGNMWDLERGKLRRRLYASKYSHQALPIASIDGSRFGLCYGFYTGEVATISFTRDGTVVSDYTDLPYRHDSAVTAIWMAKHRQVSKSPKHADEAAVVASGSTDGTVFLLRPGLHRRYRPTDNGVVLLEGTMHGTYVKNDGSIVASLDLMGTLTLLDLVSEPRELARLPFGLETAQFGIQLHMANDYVIVQTTAAVYVVDIHTGSVRTLVPPDGHNICAFGIDKSFTPGTKYIATGFSNNEISVWELPPPIPISIVRMDSSSSPEPASRNTSESDAPEREVPSTPLWTLPNPIGYDHRLESAGKPQITQLALNAAVLLVAGYNGLVTAMDVLSGQTLKRVSSRISKNVLDFMLYSRDGLVPVTHLEIDPNPLYFRAIVATRPALQFLDLGPLDTKHGPRRHPRRAKRGGTPHIHATSRHDLEEEIEMRHEFAELDAQREETQRALRETFALENLGEEEQMEYAMMLSEQASETASTSPHGFNDNDNYRDDADDNDEELRRALELSAATGEQQQPNAAEPELPNGNEDDEVDEDLRRALELSTAEERHGAGAEREQTGRTDEDDGMDEDLRRAIELSMRVQ